MKENNKRVLVAFGQLIALLFVLRVLAYVGAKNLAAGFILFILFFGSISYIWWHSRKKK